MDQNSLELPQLSEQFHKRHKGKKYPLNLEGCQRLLQLLNYGERELKLHTFFFQKVMMESLSCKLQDAKVSN